MKLIERRQLAPVRLASFAIIASASWLLFINFCNLVYQCGCESLWAGAATRCNIHHATGPHCPWCVDVWSGPVVLGVATCVQALVLLAPGAITLIPRLIGAALSLPIVGGVLAIAFGTARGYWSG